MKVGLDSIAGVVQVREASLEMLPGARQVLYREFLPDGQVSGLWTEQMVAKLPCGLDVRTQGTHGQGLRLVVSGSLPKVAQGHNVTALEISEAVSIVRDVVIPELEDVAEGVRGEEWVNSRLDTVTDLRCSEADMAPVLRALESVPIRKGLTRQLLRSTLERPETLWARNKGGGMRLYDNGLDKLLKGAPFDVVDKLASGLRAEGQQMRYWCRKHRTRELRDLERFPDNVVQLHAARIAWAGLDREVMALDTWIERLGRHCDAEGISDTVRYGVMGYLLDCAVGRPMAHRSAATLAKYRRIAREGGVHPADLMRTATAKVAYRLDFEKGEVVRRVA